jgi:hypothetical protein
LIFHFARHTDKVRVQEAAELVAIDVFQRAEATGQPITLGLVERRLDELRSHEPECACGLCTAANSSSRLLVWCGFDGATLMS